MSVRILTAAAALAVLAAVPASAQMTPEIRAKVAEIGRFVDPPSTALVYRPLHASPPYAGVTVTRDQSYGPDARNILDIFQPAGGGAPKTVLVHVSGGAGNKIEPVPQGDAFYDNIMLFVTKNGMVGVNIQRRSQQTSWDTSGEDVKLAVQWVRANIARYGGNPDRVFLWGHSAGSMAVANYISHAHLHPGGLGVKGAVISGGAWNIAPVTVNAPPIQVRMGMNAPPPPAPTGPRPPPLEPAVLLQRSVLPGLKALPIPLFINAGELEPPIILATVEALNKELCAAGKCPKFAVFKDHGHMSEMFAVNTADTSTSQPILDFINSVK